VADFPDLDEQEIVREVQRAREAVALATLEEDVLFVAETIVRYQLLMLTGEMPDAARLDPETHLRRQQSVD
jgi:hypothetical protein